MIGDGPEFADPQDGPNRTPHSIEAEQAFIGAILFDPGSLDELDLTLQPSHFYEPLHGRLYQSILRTRDAGLQPDAVALWEEMRRDKALIELGGLRYLADLIDHAPMRVMIPTFAKTIHETHNRRRLIQLSEEIGRLARAGGIDDDGASIDTEAILEVAEAGLMEMQRADPRLVPVGIEEAADDVIAYVDDKETMRGINTGLAAVHDIIGPMLPGEMILLPGRPSMGKSALACNIVMRVAAPEWWREREMGGNVGLFEAGENLAHTMGIRLPAAAGVLELNGEMSVGQMMRRHYADIGYALYGSDFPTFKSIRDKHITVDQREMMLRVREVLRTTPIVMLKRSGLRVSQLRSIGRRQIAIWKRDGVEPGMMVIDHVGLLRAEGRTSGRYESQTEIAIDLHQLAEDLGIPILALVQLSRQVESRDDKRPQMSDLRDSGAWEENADAIIFPFREAYYAQKETEPEVGANQGMDWADWDRRCKSKDLEIIPGKVREGSTARSTKAWIDVAWNAVRGSEPDIKGRMI